MMSAILNFIRNCLGVIFYMFIAAAIVAGFIVGGFLVGVAGFLIMIVFIGFLIREFTKG